MLHKLNSQPAFTSRVTMSIDAAEAISKSYDKSVSQSIQKQIKTLENNGNDDIVNLDYFKNNLGRGCLVMRVIEQNGEQMFTGCAQDYLIKRSDNHVKVVNMNTLYNLAKEEKQSTDVAPSFMKYV